MGFLGPTGATATNPPISNPAFPLPRFEFPAVHYASPGKLFDIPALNASMPMPLPPPAAITSSNAPVSSRTLVVSAAAVLALFFILKL
jgi:hypothetical protein